VDVFPVKAITSMYFLNGVSYYTENNIPINTDEITNGFCVLSRLSRFHRTYFVSQLFCHNLQNYGQIGYHNINDLQTSANSGEDSYESPCWFLTTSPFTRNNTEITIKDRRHQQQVQEFQHHVPYFKNFIEDLNIESKRRAMLPNCKILQSSLVYVALETVVNYPEVFLSGISFKGIINKRPFIIFGVPGTIKYLQSLGFQTFSDFWSEEYDNIHDIEDRVDAIMTILQDIATKSPDELKTMAQAMSEKLEFNFQHLITTFREQQCQNILAGIQ
jgi:hypothetical protein